MAKEMAKEWTHFDLKGNARMVDVSEKESTRRLAVASGEIAVNEAVMQAVTGHTAAKGDVLCSDCRNYGSQTDRIADSHVPYDPD